MSKVCVSSASIACILCATFFASMSDNNIDIWVEKVKVYFKKNAFDNPYDSNLIR